MGRFRCPGVLGAGITILGLSWAYQRHEASAVAEHARRPPPPIATVNGRWPLSTSDDGGSATREVVDYTGHVNGDRALRTGAKGRAVRSGRDRPSAAGELKRHQRPNRRCCRRLGTTSKGGET